MSEREIKAVEVGANFMISALPMPDGLPLATLAAAGEPHSAFRISQRSIYFLRKEYLISHSAARISMQTYDLLMILVLVAATLFGFWKGMAWQVASLASLVVSYFAALRFADQLAPAISNHAPWNKFVAMLAIYIATSFVIWTIFRMVSGIIDRVKLDGFDHQMGAMIGFAKGVLLTIAITFFAVTILPQAQKDSIIDSQTGAYIIRFLDETHTFVPPELQAVIHPYVEKIEQRLDRNYQGHAGANLPTSLSDIQDFSWPTQPQAQPIPPREAQPIPQNNGWPQQTQTTTEQPQQPSVYDQRPAQQPSSVWPQQTQSQTQVPPHSQPGWPAQPQTADRPSGSPL